MSSKACASPSPPAGPVTADAPLGVRCRPHVVLEATSLVAIVAIAAYLRLADLEFAQFLYDDVTLWNLVRDFARQPGILNRGMHSSFGIENGPFQVYMLAPGLLTAPSPIGAYYVVAVWNVVGVVLFWAFVRRYWDGRLALLAVLLYAVNPWAVIFSRRLWGNDLLAPFNVLLIWALCDLVRHGRRRDSIMSLVWLACVAQVYVVGFVQLLLAAPALVLGARRLRPLYLFAGLTLFAVLIGPYFFEKVLPALASLVRLMGFASETPATDAASLKLMLHTVSSEGYQAFANHAGLRVDASGGLPWLASLATEVMLVVGFGVAFVEIARQWRRGSVAHAAPQVLAVSAVVLPVLLLVRHTMQVQPYHLLTGFPMPFLLVALGMRQTVRTLRSIAIRFGVAVDGAPGYVASALVVFVVGTHLLLAREFFAAIRTYAPTVEYGMPLRYSLDVVATAQRLVAETGATKVYVGGPELREGIIYLAMRRDLPAVSPFGSNDSLIMPAPDEGKVLYILASNADRVGRVFDRQLASARLAVFDVPGAALRYSFYCLTQGELDAAVGRPLATPVAVTFDGQVRLESFAMDRELRPGTPHQLTLGWTVLEGGGVARPTYYAFVRLMNESGEVDHGSEFPFYAVGRWDPGERVITWRDVPVPARLEPGVYWYLVGLYHLTPGGYRNAVAVDAAGRPVGEGIRIGHLVVRSSHAADPSHRLSASFGESVALEGYDLGEGGLLTGAKLDVSLYWRALDRLERDYTVFVHLLGPDGRLVSQHDGQPGGGQFPTSAWLPGDTIVDRHQVPLPQGLAQGAYRLAIGLYDGATGERLGGPDAAAVVALPGSGSGR